MGIALSDALLLLATMTALWAARSRLRALVVRGKAVWALSGIALAYIFVSCLYPLLWQEEYQVATNLVTAAKFAEYAALALTAGLLLGERRARRAVFAALAGWSTLATIVAVLQFTGVDIFDAWRSGGRQPSFVGIHDLAALSGAALVLAAVTLLFGAEDTDGRRVAWLAGISGWLGLVLSGSVAPAIGLALAALTIWVAARQRGHADRKRALALAAVVVSAMAGVIGLRGNEIGDFLRFTGILPAKAEIRNVESFGQRSILAYIGLREFAGHPFFGVGWQGSSEQQNYEPYLADAHARFPDQPAEAFPSPAHPWGVQNAPIQALADLGAVGTVPLAGLIGLLLFVAMRRSLRAESDLARGSAIALGWMVIALTALTAIGLVAGLPSDALFWLAVGLLLARQEL